ncbi:MAG: fibronectin type III domain-containing protein, partial [Aquihabitans sp.]
MSSRRSFTALVTGALVAGVLAFSPAAEATPGAQDPGFGTGGVLTGYPGNSEAVATANDGKIYLVTVDELGTSGTIRLQRYTSTGVLDTTFSGDGTVEFATPGGTNGLVAVDSSNRPVLAASYRSDTAPYQLWRFTTSGVLDTTFAGDGTLTIPWVPSGRPLLSGLGFQPDGDIILGTNEGFPIGGLSQFPRFTRVTTAGVVKQSVDVLDAFTESYAGGGALLDVDAAGRVYVLVPDDGKLNLRRYTESLVLDTTYSGDGLVSVGRPGGSGDTENWGSGLTVTSAGVAYVAGTVGVHTGGPMPVRQQKGLLLARLTTSGALDIGFSTDGIVLASVPTAGDPYDTSPQAIELASGDRPVLVGSQTFLEGATGKTLLWQYTLAGAPDSAFSGDGRVEAAGEYVTGTAIAQAGSRLLLLTYDDLRSYELAVPAPVTVPGTPAAPTVLAGDGQVNVSWTAPASDGGSPVTGYTITPYIGGFAQPAVNVNASPRSKMITGLTNGTAYTFTVSAKNVVGTGTPSTQSSAVTPSPAPPGPDGAVFVAIAPCRVADTRNGGGALASGATRAFQVSGSGSGFAAQ